MIAAGTAPLGSRRVRSAGLVPFLAAGIVMLFSNPLHGRDRPIPQEKDRPIESSAQATTSAPVAYGELRYRVAGTWEHEGCGQVVVTLPDLDHDTYPDLAVGAPDATVDDRVEAGLVRWISGATGTEIQRFAGPLAGMRVGASIAAPGDLDLDGFIDIVVGAPGTSTNRSNGGAVIAVSGVDGSILWQVDEVVGSSQLGWTVAGLEDFDRDGIPEVLTSGPGSSSNDRGRFMLISGASGFVLKAARFGERGDETGAALAVIDDLDGDGKCEILLGAPNALEGAGAVYVISRERNPYLILPGQVPGQRFGAALAGTPDKNGDGVPDLLVGAPGSSGDAGQTLLLSGLDGSEISSVTGVPGEGFGSAVQASWDHDGDGITDLAIGSPRKVVATGETAGAVSVFSGLDGKLITTLDGTTPDSGMGLALAGLPDQDGDGRDELVVGIPGQDLPCTAGAGRFEVLSIKEKSAVLYELSADSFNPLGSSVHSAGDVDGDQYPDYLVGVPLEDPNMLHDAGSAFIFSGRDGGFIRRMNGTVVDGQFGSAVADLGDIDLDGHSDYVIGTPRTGVSFQSGSVEVFSGIDAQLLYRIDGFDAGDRFGTAFCTRHDFDGDGFRDLVIGAPQADPNGVVDAGRVDLFSGFDGSHLAAFRGTEMNGRVGSSLVVIPSIDGDPVPEILIGAPESSPGRRLGSGAVSVVSGADLGVIRGHVGENFFDHLGTAVTGVADADSNGIHDYLISAPDANPRGRPDAGAAYLHSGATGALIRRIEGTQNGERLGSAMADVGDTNGDGISDYVIGMRGADSGPNPGAGRVVLYSGRDDTVLLQYDGRSTGLAVGDAVAAAGDVDADGFPELLAAGSGLGQNGNGGLMTVLDPEVSLDRRAMVGNVNRGAGLPADVLLVNGTSSVANGRTLQVSLHEPVTVDLLPPPMDGARTTAEFILFVWFDAPDESTVTATPFAMGKSIFPLPFTGGSPQPDLVINGLPDPTCFATGDPPELNANGEIYSIPEGFSSPTTVTVQALVPDPGSASPEGYSLTNAIVIVAE